MSWLVGLGVLALVVFWFVITYNALVRLRNQMREAWSGIDVQLKRRFDLVPNLVETVKGYAGHEKTVFEEVTKARGLVQTVQASPSTGGTPSAEAMVARAQAEGALTQSIRGLFAVAESYPELKANANFLELQRNLGDIEDQLQLARRYYNGTVREMNTMVESIPSSIVANIGGFGCGEYFEIENAAERQVPAVRF